MISILAYVAITISPASPATADSQYGGTLNIGVGYYYPGFCVGNNPNAEILSSYRTMYEPLVERDADGVLRPYLAEIISANAANTVWTIKLRAGITYHDGEVFSATNVKLNIDALRGFLFTSISKAYLFGTSAPTLANILDVTVLEPLVLSIALELPQIDFLETLYADGKSFMRSTTQLASNTGCANSPSGTGPFKIDSWSTDRLSVYRNDNYWRRDKSGNQLPYLNRINFVTKNDAEVRKDLLQTGDYDAALFVSNYESDSISGLRATSADLRETDSQNIFLDTIFINATKTGSPLKSLNARKALAAATNTSGLRDETSGGLGELPTALFSPNSSMHSTDQYIPYDLAQAKFYKSAYIAEGESGLAAGVPFTVMIPSNTSLNSQRSVVALRTMWLAAGVGVDVVIEEAGPMLAKAFNSSKTGAEQNSYDVIRLTRYLSPHSSATNTAILRNDAFNPESINTIDAVTGRSVKSVFGSYLNLTHHQNNSVDIQLLDARAQLARKAAAAKFRSAMAYFQSQAYAIPLTSGFVALFANKQIAGIANNYLPSGEQAMTMGHYGPDWSTVYISGNSAPLRNLGVATEKQNIGWVGAQPKGLAVIDANEVYVARTNEGEICRIYSDNASVESCVDVGGRPVGLRLNSDKTKLFFLDPETKKVRRLITATSAVSDIATLPSRPSSFALNRTETQLFVTSDIANVVYRVTTTGGSILSTIDVPGGPDGISLDPDGQTMWISQSEFGSVVRAGYADVANQPLDSLTNSRTILVGNHPASSALSSDNKFLYVSDINDGTLSRISTESLLVTHIMKVDAEPNAISLVDSENRAIIAYRFSNSLGQVSLPVDSVVPVPVDPVVPAPVDPVVPAPVVPVIPAAVVDTPATPAPISPPPTAPASVIPVVVSPANTSATTTSPVQLMQSSSKVVSSAPVLTMKKLVTTKSIVTYANLKAVSGSKVSVKVSPLSVKLCKVVGTSVKALKVGSCKVTVTVSPKKGKPKSKTITLKVVK